jgi:four helix bundle protein
MKKRGRRGEEESSMPERIESHRDLVVYRRSFDAAMMLFQYSKKFPREEAYSLTDQVRRSSRSVSANLTEAWRKRRYEAAFVSKLSDAETEAAETQTWIEYAVACNYLDSNTASQLAAIYDEIIRMIVAMISAPEKWVMPKR